MSITSAVRGHMEFLFADFLGTPLWMWSAFITIVAALLVFDLGVLMASDISCRLGQSCPIMCMC